MSLITDSVKAAHRDKHPSQQQQQQTFQNRLKILRILEISFGSHSQSRVGGATSHYNRNRLYVL